MLKIFNGDQAPMKMIVVLKDGVGTTMGRRGHRHWALRGEGEARTDFIQYDRRRHGRGAERRHWFKEANVTAGCGEKSGETAKVGADGGSAASSPFAGAAKAFVGSRALNKDWKSVSADRSKRMSERIDKLSEAADNFRRKAEEWSGKLAAKAGRCSASKEEKLTKKILKWRERAEFALQKAAIIAEKMKKVSGQEEEVVVEGNEEEDEDEDRLIALACEELDEEAETEAEAEIAVPVASIDDSLLSSPQLFVDAPEAVALSSSTEGCAQSAQSTTQVEPESGPFAGLSVSAQPPTAADGVMVWSRVWARELEVLAAMGFTDASVVLPLLQEHVGVPVSLCPELNGIPSPEGLQRVVGALFSRSGRL